MNIWISIAILSAQVIFASHPNVADQKFAFDFLEQIESQEKNQVFSPFSVSACLSMVAAGANTDTEKEMRDVLNLPAEIGPFFEEKMGALKHDPTYDSDFQLNIAQGIWIKEDFAILPSFSSLLFNSFQAVAERVAFTPYTADRINDWIANETHQKIQNLIPPSILTPETRLVLANALHFRGSWRHPFLSGATHLRPFYLSSGKAIEALTMSQTAQLPYFENNSFQAVALPFDRAWNSASELICLLILSKTKLRLNSRSFSLIVSSLKEAPVHLQVPKFTIEQSLELKEILQNLGMRNAFTEKADFSKINGLLDLYISAVFHKSIFEFDENGVEAAAATAGVIQVTSINPQSAQSFSFKADHPFYFVLFDQKTQTILFLGRVQNPQYK